ncbi:MAG TPA: EAL domain-containing protein [Candidatus Limnocylindria bacterium]|nr:EAL domain-containing protein [Candidatus Limnocylindria bacterium]
MTVPGEMLPGQREPAAPPVRDPDEGQRAAPGTPRSTSDLLARISQAGSMLVYVMDIEADGTYRCLEFAGLEGILGTVPQDVTPEAAFEAAVHPDDRAAYDEAYRAVVAGQPSELEYRLIGYDGRVRWVLDRMRPHVTPHGRLLVDGVVTDISESRNVSLALAKAQQHAYAARTDALTGLPTRLAFHEHLQVALTRAAGGAGCAVLFVDLDNFKLVNDSFGHAAGDELLAAVARRFRSAARIGDLIARQGGDEFLVLLVPDAPAAAPVGSFDVAHAAVELARRLRSSLREPIRVDGHEVYVTASIGISLYPHDADDAESLLKHADIAMYAAKDSGRDAIRKYTATDDTALAELSMTGRLRRAVEQGTGLVLHYQPLVMLETGEAEGLEALLRWQDGDRGLVPPAKFLPLAERVGLMGRISDWVVTEACGQAATWRAAGLGLYVSVNLPPTHFDARGMRRLLTTLDDCELPSDRLVIEITEAVVVDHGWNRILPGLTALRRRGVRLAIDDFGSGHSSLGRLSDDWVSMIKIDRSFIAGLTRSRHSRALVTSILQLARNLGIEPVAEGIETEDQRRLLLELGCRRGQGFLFSRPVAAEAIPALVASQGPA